MVVAAGGTGGHMFPAVSTAEELVRRGWKVDLLTDIRGARYVGGRDSGARVAAVPLGSPYRGGPAARAVAPFLLAWASARLAVDFLLARPACVVAFGGYATVPALAAATVLGAPRVVHEQNAILGRVNRFFVRCGARLACGVAEPPHAPRGSEIVGIPVRPEVADLAGQPYAPPAEGEAIRIVVVGGSQGSRNVARMSAEALSRAPATLRHRFRVACQVRDEDREEIEQVLRVAEIRAETEPFFGDLPDRVAASHLVVARSGASTLAELSAIGRPAILIPLPTAAADHQASNARAYAGAGAALVFKERGGTAEDLGKTITTVIADTARLAAMAAAAHGALKTGAVAELAALAERQAAEPTERPA